MRAGAPPRWTKAGKGSLTCQVSRQLLDNELSRRFRSRPSVAQNGRKTTDITMTRPMRENVPSKWMVTSLLVTGLMTAGSVAYGQVRGRQSFTVRVGPKVIVTAPSAEVTMKHDRKNPDTLSAAQRWIVDTNSQSGATVSFSTNQAFTHTARPEFKRDAALQLAIPTSANGAQWEVVVGSDRTRHVLGAAGEKATVRAVSRRPGQGAFDITVTFLADPNDTLESGDYALTLVGTVTSN
jgi:hypothetical protein